MNIIEYLENKKICKQQSGGHEAKIKIKNKAGKFATSVSSTDPLILLEDCFELVRGMHTAHGFDDGLIQKAISVLHDFSEQIQQNTNIPKEKRISLHERVQISCSTLDEITAMITVPNGQSGSKVWDLLTDRKFSILYEPDVGSRSKHGVATAAILPPKGLLHIAHQFYRDHGVDSFDSVSSQDRVPEACFKYYALENKAFEESVSKVATNGQHCVCIIGIGMFGVHFICKDFKGRYYNSFTSHKSVDAGHVLMHEMDTLNDILEEIKQYPSLSLGKNIAFVVDGSPWLKDVLHYKNVANPSFDTLFLQERRPFMILEGKYIDSNESIASKQYPQIVWNRTIPFHTYNKKEKGPTSILATLADPGIGLTSDAPSFLQFIPESYSVCFPGDVPVVFKYKCIDNQLDIDECFVIALQQLLGILNKTLNIATFDAVSKNTFECINDHLENQTKTKDLQMYMSEWQKKFISTYVQDDVSPRVSKLLKEACETISTTFVETKRYQDILDALKDYDFAILQADSIRKCDIESHYQNSYYRNVLETSLFHNKFFINYLLTDNQLIEHIKDSTKTNKCVLLHMSEAYCTN